MVRVISPQDGLGQWTDRVDVTLPRLAAGATSTAAFAAGAVYLYRFQLAAPLTITKMGLYCGATVVASTVDLGIYTGTITGTTFTRLISTTPFTPTANNETQQALSATVTLSAGVPYWAALGNNHATNTILRLSSAGELTDTGNAALVLTGAWSSGLPASIPTPVGTNLVPWLSVIA